MNAPRPDEESMIGTPTYWNTEIPNIGKRIHTIIRTSGTLDGILYSELDDSQNISAVMNPYFDLISKCHYLVESASHDDRMMILDYILDNETFSNWNGNSGKRDYTPLNDAIENARDSKNDLDEKGLRDNLRNILDCGFNIRYADLNIDKDDLPEIYLDMLRGKILKCEFQIIAKDVNSSYKGDFNHSISHATEFVQYVIENMEDGNKRTVLEDEYRSLVSQIPCILNEDSLRYKHELWDAIKTELNLQKDTITLFYISAKNNSVHDNGPFSRDVIANVYESMANISKRIPEFNNGLIARYVECEISDIKTILIPKLETKLQSSSVESVSISIT